jgi:hypothetical protein
MASIAGGFGVEAGHRIILRMLRDVSRIGGIAYGVEAALQTSQILAGRKWTMQ